MNLKVKSLRCKRILLPFQLFDKLRTTHPGQLEKVIAITGDIVQDNIGISEKDEMTLCQNVSIVFHSAATVKFDEHLKYESVLQFRHRYVK